MAAKKPTSRKVKDKEFEKFEATGLDGKAGDKAAKEVFDLERKDREKEEKAQLEILDHKKKYTKKSYNEYLANLLRNELRANEWPYKWQYFVGSNPVGVIMEIHSADGKIFRTAFKSTGVPGYDLNAVDLYAQRAQGTVDQHMESTEIIV